MTREDAVGKKFGRLLVTGWTPGKDDTILICVCDCGNKKEIRYKSVTSGQAKSCGCYRDEMVKTQSITHGSSYTKTYRIYAGMKSRCLNPKGHAYHNYGGRGITVCERWLGRNGFKNFLADMGECPPKYSIERKDVNGNYEPGNCVWIPKREQSRNLRKTIRITFDGVTKTLREWSLEKSISRNDIYFRLTSGWPTERLFDPVYTRLDPNHRNARKLSWEKAEEIRQRHRASGLSHRKIAQEFGVARSLVSAILRGNVWVKSPAPST